MSPQTIDSGTDRPQHALARDDEAPSGSSGKGSAGSGAEAGSGSEDVTRDRLGEAVISLTSADRKSISLNGLFILACLFSLYFAASLLIPIVVAVLLSVMLSPIVRFLERRGVHTIIGATIVMVFMVATVATTVGGLTGAAQDWFERIPRNFYRIEQKLQPLKKQFSEITNATEKLEEAANVKAERPIKVSVERPSIVEQFMTGTPQVLASLGMIGVLLFFLLASGDTFLRKLVSISSEFEEKKRAVEITRSIQTDISFYLATLSAINVGMGVVVGLLCWAMNIPNPELWGVIVCVLSFAPYAGSIAIAGILSFVGLLTFESWFQALTPAAVYLVMIIAVGNFIIPVVLGRRLTLSPLAIFLSIIFWGWMWGIVGALVAVPLLACFKIICERVTSLQPVAEFLAP